MIPLTFTAISEMTCSRSVHSLSFSRAHRDTDLFIHKINAGIVRDLATEIAKTSPKAFILVISNPVNSTVPIVAEVLKKHNAFDPKRYHQTPALNHMNYLLTKLILVSGSLASPP
jgi:hypothetical protein